MRGSRGSQLVTGGYCTTSGYRVYWELQVGFIHFGIIFFYFAFYLQNISFFNFSVLLETVIKD